MTDVAARPYHHGNLREELLDRAEAILRERGAAELSLREIARDIGVSHAAPRRHFPDRQALLDALALHGFRRLGETLAAAVSARGSFEHRLKKLATAYVVFATQDAALLELMFAGKHHDEALHAVADDAFAPVLALIAEGFTTGEIAGRDPLETGMVMFATIQGLAALANGDMLDGASVEPLAAAAVSVLLDGLRPR